jgi:hypothetical protein
MPSTTRSFDDIPDDETIYNIFAAAGWGYDNYANGSLYYHHLSDPYGAVLVVPHRPYMSDVQSAWLEFIRYNKTSTV